LTKRKFGLHPNKESSDEINVNCQQFIPRCYGSLTTLNALLKNKEYWFVGDKGNK
jgi:hypothetical protein